MSRHSPPVLLPARPPNACPTSSPSEPFCARRGSSKCIRVWYTEMKMFFILHLLFVLVGTTLRAVYAVLVAMLKALCTERVPTGKHDSILENFQLVRAHRTRILCKSLRHRDCDAKWHSHVSSSDLIQPGEAGNFRYRPPGTCFPYILLHVFIKYKPPCGCLVCPPAMEPVLKLPNHSQRNLAKPLLLLRLVRLVCVSHLTHQIRHLPFPHACARGIFVVKKQMQSHPDRMHSVCEGKRQLLQFVLASELF